MVGSQPSILYIDPVTDVLVYVVYKSFLICLLVILHISSALFSISISISITIISLAMVMTLMAVA